MSTPAPPPPKATKKPAVPRAAWNAACDAKLVECLEEHKRDGRMGSNSSWHKDVWADVETKLAGSEVQSGGARKTAVSCHNRWTSLKKDYVCVKKLREKSGFGWDESTQLVTGTDEVWDVLLQVDRPLAKWRSTPFPLYDSIHDIVVGTVATGKGAFRPGRDYTPASSPGPAAFASDDHDVDSSDPPAGSDENDTLSGSDDSVQVLTHAAAAPAPLGPVQTQSSTINERKRAADNHGHSESMSSKRKSKSKSQTSLDNVASSVGDVASALKYSGGEPSPERRKAAIKIIEDDGDLSDHEQIKIFKVIRRDVAVADFIVGIRDKAKRTLYIQSELDDA